MKSWMPHNRPWAPQKTALIFSAQDATPQPGAKDISKSVISDGERGVEIVGPKKKTWAGHRVSSLKKISGES